MGAKALVSVFASLPVADQLGLLADWAMAGQASVQPMTDYLDLVHATPTRADPLVWGSVATTLREIDELYEGLGKRQDEFRAFAVRTLEPAFAEIGWQARPDEPGNVAILRQDLIWTLGKFGAASVIEEARRRFDAFLTDPASLPASVRAATLQVVAYNADAATFDRFAARALASTTALEARQMLGTLVEVRDPVLAARAIELSLSAKVAPTLTPDLIQRLGMIHPDLAWTFARDHWDVVQERVDTMAQTRFMPNLAARSLDPDRIAEMRRFVKDTLPVEAVRDADKAEAVIRFRTRVRKDQLPKIDAWLGRVSF